MFDKSRCVLQYEENIDIPAEILYKVVLDVADYPGFIPWCRAVSVISHTSELIIADLVAGFKGVNGKYTSKISFHAPSSNSAGWISAEATTDSLFKYLFNKWEFLPLSSRDTQIRFFIEFEFKSRFLQKTFGVFYQKAQKNIVDAFTKQARKIQAS